MRITSGMPIRGRESILTLALAVYAVSSLVSMAVMNIGAAILIASVVLTVGWKGLGRRISAAVSEKKTRRFTIATLLLAIACVMSLVVGAADPVTYNGAQAEFRFSDIRKFWYFLIPFAVLIGLSEIGPKGRRTVWISWLIAFAALSVVGIVQFYTGWPRPQPIPGYPGRFHSILFMGHHLSVASVWIFPLFASLDLLKARAKGVPVWGFAGIAILGTVTLFLGYSRMAWVAVPLGLLIWAALSLPRKGLISILVAMGVLIGVASTQPAVVKRVTSKMGSETRIALWEANLEFFKKRPITGVGFRKTEFLSGQYLLEKTRKKTVFSGHAHNNFLEMLGGTGAFGAFAWLFWSFCVFMLYVPDLRRRDPGVEVRFAAGLFCAWIVFHFNGLTQVNFWEGKVMHQMMLAVGWGLWWRAQDRETAARAS